MKIVRRFEQNHAALAAREADGGKAVELPPALVVTAEGSHHDYYADGWNDCRRKVRELAARDAAHVKDSLTTAQPAVPDGFVPSKLRAMFAYEFWQLAKIDDGRAMLMLSEDHYNAIRAMLAAKGGE